MSSYSSPLACKGASPGLKETAGIAEIVAGSIAMGLDGYLSARMEIEHYQTELHREYQEVDIIPEQEKKEVMEVFADYGLNERLQTEIANDMYQNKSQ